MSIFVDERTKVVVQGLTGGQGRFHGLRNRDYGTQVVGGVTPGKGGSDVEGIPVFDTMTEAVEATDADASFVVVPPKAASAAILEAASARGLQTDVRMIGDPGVPPAEVAGAVLETVGAVFGTLPPHQVLLTVLASADDVELLVTFEEPMRDAPDLTRSGRDVLAAARWQAAITIEDSGTNAAVGQSVRPNRLANGAETSGAGRRVRRRRAEERIAPPRRAWRPAPPA